MCVMPKRNAGPMKKDKIFTRNLDGKIIEIGNWKARTSSDDAFVGTPLSDSGLRQLRRGRELGQSDPQIFNDIQKRKQARRPALSLEELTIPQLIKIATNLLESELTSLEQMTRSDLIMMVRQLAKMKKVNIGFDIDLNQE